MHINVSQQGSKRRIDWGECMTNEEQISCKDVARTGEDKKYEALSAEYDKFLEARKIAFDQTKYIYENLDKWLLSLSGGGVALTSASIAISGKSNLPWLFGFAAISFVAAIMFALLAKGISYQVTRWYVLKTDQIWQDHHHTFTKCHRELTTGTLRLHDRIGTALNILCFIFFILGLTLLATSSIQHTGDTNNETKLNLNGTPAYSTASTSSPTEAARTAGKTDSNTEGTASIHAPSPTSSSSETQSASGSKQPELAASQQTDGKWLEFIGRILGPLLAGIITAFVAFKLFGKTRQKESAQHLLIACSDLVKLSGSFFPLLNGAITNIDFASSQPGCNVNYSRVQFEVKVCDLKHQTMSCEMLNNDEQIGNTLEKLKNSFDRILISHNNINEFDTYYQDHYNDTEMYNELYRTLREQSPIIESQLEILSKQLRMPGQVANPLIVRNDFTVS